jgi:hypothetical protein
MQELDAALRLHLALYAALWVLIDAVKKLKD